jgi:hypothetical protein
MLHLADAGSELATVGAHFVHWAQLLNDSSLASSLRLSRYAFPIIEGLHLLGLAFSVGLLLLIDLRLMGAFLRSESAGQVLQQLRPVAIGGFVVTFATGLLLFAASASDLIVSKVFLLKLVVLALAGMNAVLFEFKLGRGRSGWVHPGRLPWGVKAAGWTSFVLWTAAVVCGRMIPYLG